MAHVHCTLCVCVCIIYSYNNVVYTYGAHALHIGTCTAHYIYVAYAYGAHTLHIISLYCLRLRCTYTAPTLHILLFSKKIFSF